MSAVSPLAPAEFPKLGPIAGVRLAAFACGIRYTGRDDLMLAELAPGSAIAGVFTRSLTAGAPVLWCRECLPGGKVRGIVVNSGNSNVFTGRAGKELVEKTAATAAGLLGCDPRQIFISSTGVIGEPPPAGKIIGALPQIVPLLSADGWEAAARAILTTDTFPKGATATAEIDGVEVRLSGFAKGSGMIAPDMATMLAYVFTDAALPPAVLQPLLTASADRSFNCMTVHGDTSTSDTVLLCATQRAPHPPVARSGDGRSRPAGRSRWRGRAEIRDDRGDRCCNGAGGASDRPDDRQLPIGQDRAFGRRPELGPHRHGGGASRGEDRSRSIGDLDRRPTNPCQRRSGTGL